MDVIKFEPQHYEEVSSWWKAHNWSVVGMESLPTNGFIVPGVCAGFLYMTDSNICLLEWVISNPECSKEIRSQSLDVLIERILKTAEELNYKIVFSTVSHPKLINRYESFNFKKTDLNMTNMIRVL